MSYYAIGIGGSGAKCLEALIHLSAAGLMPDKDNLYLLFVDSDRSNGNGTRSEQLFRTYQECRANYVGGEDLFKTAIPRLQSAGDANTPNSWSPTRIGERLDNFIVKENLEENYKYFFDMMFSPQEAATVLNEGFRGRPSIGAAVMANAVNLHETEPWQSMRQRMQADAGMGQVSKVVVFGSIFGGTGAAGFPTISRLLSDWAQNARENPLQIGGVLLMPYFSFDSNAIPQNEVHVQSHDFVLNTQAALRYYHQQNFHEFINVTYLLGADQQREMPVTSLGSATQENPAHWIELCGALAAVDFFGADNAASATYRLLGCNSADNLQWEDLPHAEVQEKLLKLARFSFAFLSTYYPMLENIESTGSGYRAPWYVDFFENQNLNLRERLGSELTSVKEYCEKFLRWLANIEFSINGQDNESHQLIPYTSFAHNILNPATNTNEITLLGRNRDNDTFEANFLENGFAEILLPNMSRDNADLASLWERLCRELPSNPSIVNSWPFINALYRQCGSH
ncbi:MAG: hypothetical protein IPN69_00900 [Acidobacteria bacterium]|nr:hypothetical protein [Acidobacteriota bacterium]